MDVSQYMSMFLEESMDNLQTLNEALLDLEQEPEDIDKYEDGYTNPDLIRIHEPEPVPFDAPDKDHSVPFNPYNNTPQFEFKPRDYLLYISDVNSYRLVDIHNHDEDSEFWEIP